MKIQLIRNATMKITYAGRTILTDPMLAPKDAYDPFAGVARNPTVGLPFPVEDIIQGVDGVLVSHNHPDHFDAVAGDVLPKDLPVFCQPGDEKMLSDAGFRSVLAIESVHAWDGITITRTQGRHGSGELLDLMGVVSGFVLQADGEPTVYWAGDTIWFEAVEKTIASFDPDVVVTHSGGATLPGFAPIIMDGDQTLATLKASSNAVVVAIHLEALDHCTVSRGALRQMAEQQDVVPTRLMIPVDGETIVL